MAIITSGPIIRRGQALEEFETPFADYVRAQFDQSFAGNLTTLLVDRGMFNDQQYGQDAPAAFSVGDQMMGPRREPPKLEAEIAAARIAEAGVKIEVPEEGITEGALNVLIRRKRDELVRLDAINRSPAGMRSVAGFGAQVAATLLDPLNVASAFIPVVGQARYTALIAGAAGAVGRAGVRAGVGAVEGAVGAALLEPAIYGLHQQLQDEYTMADSLVNLAVGSVMGGGLHIGGGAVRDFAQPGWWKPETAPGSAARAVSDLDYEGRLRTTQSTVAQVAQGRIVDVEAQVRLESARVGKAYDDVLAGPLGDPNSPVVHMTPEGIGEVLLERGPNFPAKGEVEVRAGGYGLVKIIWKHGEKSPELPEFQVTREDVMRTPAVLRQFAPIEDRTQPDGKRLLEWQVERADGKRVVYSVRGFSDGDKAQHVVSIFVNREDLPEFRAKPTSQPVGGKPESPAGGSMPPGRDTGGQALLSPTDGQGDASVARTMQDVQDAARRSASPESVAVADFPAARAADERLKAAPKDEGVQAAEAELQEVLGKIDALAKGADEKQAGRLAEEMKPFDEAIKDADKLGDAARVAAQCGL